MLELSDVACGYEDFDVLHDISFSLKKGEKLAILGANGSGKSTLIKAILGQIPYRGSIVFMKEDLSHFSTSKCMALMAYVPQNFVSPFDISVFDTVLQGRKYALSLGQHYQTDHEEKVWQAIASVGVNHLYDKAFRYLSTGERQLVLIARAIAQEAQLVILDEPFYNLDIRSQTRLQEVIGKLSSKECCVLLATHSAEHALSLCDKVVWIDNQNIIAQGAPETVCHGKYFHKIYGITTQMVVDRRGTKHLVVLGRESAKQYAS